MADDPEDPVTLDADIDEIAIAALDAGLVKFVTDSDLSKRLVADALPNQPVKQALARYLLRLLAPIVAEKAKKGGEWLGGKAMKRLGTLIGKVPGVGGLLKAIKAKLDTLKTANEAQEQFKEILRGHRPVHGHDDAEALTLDLQADLRLLADLEGLAGRIEVLRMEIADRLNPQPVLTVDFRDPSLEGGRFHYAAQRVPFIGRTEELDRLGDFLYRFAPFSWWIVVGSGGMGKSRLALELILREANVWRAGFLARGADHDWQRWQPDRPTLMIVDYAYERPDALRRMIVALRRRTDLEMPVRVLVLEREARGQWWDDFRASGGDGHAIAESLHDEPLALAAPAMDDQFRMIAETFAAAGRPLRSQEDAQDIGGQVYDLDPQIRPLFVAFLADAMARHGDERRWDRTVLMNDVLAREYERWDALGADAAHRTLLALATLCRSLTIADVLTLDAPRLPIPSAHDINDQLLSAMTARSAGGAVPPLEPDLLGELFVLDLLERGLPNDFTREALLDSAWATRPPETASSIFRIITDFPNHPAIRRFMEMPGARSPEGLRAWATVTLDFVGALAAAGHATSAHELYQTLKDLSLERPEEPELRLRRAQCAFNVIKAYGDSGDMSAAQGVYDDLRSLAADHPGEPGIAFHQAKAAVNLISDYGNRADFAPAHDLYRHLQALTAAFPDEPNIRVRLAWGATNLTIDYAKAGDADAAHAAYEELTTMARNLAWPTEDDAGRSIAKNWFQGCLAIVRLLQGADNGPLNHFLESVLDDPQLGPIASHFATDDQENEDG